VRKLELDVDLYPDTERETDAHRGGSSYGVDSLEKDSKKKDGCEGGSEKRVQRLHVLAEIAALQILYSRPYRQRLTETMLKELEEHLRETDTAWNEETLWKAYATAAPERVKGRSVVNHFADVVPLVRFALEKQPVLEPFTESVRLRFDAWMEQKAAAGTTFMADHSTSPAQTSRARTHPPGSNWTAI
jgi:type I restriction enzyme R subunit